MSCISCTVFSCKESAYLDGAALKHEKRSPAGAKGASGVKGATALIKLQGLKRLLGVNPFAGAFSSGGPIPSASLRVTLRLARRGCLAAPTPSLRFNLI